MLNLSWARAILLLSIYAVTSGIMLTEAKEIYAPMPTARRCDLKRCGFRMRLYDVRNYRRSRGSPDFGLYTSQVATLGAVEVQLFDGVPRLRKDHVRVPPFGFHTNFDRWYGHRPPPAHRYQEVYDFFLCLHKAGNQLNYQSDFFFPLDRYDKGSHEFVSTRVYRNFSFTTHVEAFFTYENNLSQDAFFEFIGDDDVWVFVNDILVLDLGGPHPSLSARFELKDIISKCNLKVGQRYKFSIFHAERRAPGSAYGISTNFPFECLPATLEEECLEGEYFDSGINACAPCSSCRHDQQIVPGTECMGRGSTMDSVKCQPIPAVEDEFCGVCHVSDRVCTTLQDLRFDIYFVVHANLKNLDQSTWELIQESLVAIGGNLEFGHDAVHASYIRCTSDSEVEIPIEVECTDSKNRACSTSRDAFIEAILSSELSPFQTPTIGFGLRAAYLSIKDRQVNHPGITQIVVVVANGEALYDPIMARYAKLIRGNGVAIIALVPGDRNWYYRFIELVGREHADERILTFANFARINELIIKLSSRTECILQGDVRGEWGTIERTDEPLISPPACGTTSYAVNHRRYHMYLESCENEDTWSGYYNSKDCQVLEYREFGNCERQISACARCVPSKGGIIGSSWKVLAREFVPARKCGEPDLFYIQNEFLIVSDNCHIIDMIRDFPEYYLSSRCAMLEQGEIRQCEQPSEEGIGASDLFRIHRETSFRQLSSSRAFSSLKNREKRYAHYLSRASWYGSLIASVQTSPESALGFLLFQQIFHGYTQPELDALPRLLVLRGFSRDHVDAFFAYVGGLYGNLGNYKEFGDNKFIPDLPMSIFESILREISRVPAEAWEGSPDERYWTLIRKRLYSLSQREKYLGFGENGGSAYYSANCTESDAAMIQEFLDEHNILANNTRLFKLADNEYELRLASVIVHPVEKEQKDLIPFLRAHTIQPPGSLHPIIIYVTRGDHSALLQACVENLELARAVAANETEIAMLDEYIISFNTGSLRAHQRGSEHWVRNIKPSVETYIGFIEVYADPYRSRGEFEGFVAIVDEVLSQRYAKLVGRSISLLKLLPINPKYQVDKFISPEYTALDILTFGVRGLPIGINIPNYDYIRQEIGFKNVSLINVMALDSSNSDKNAPFIRESDQELLKKYRVLSLEIQVALHELLGHGSGKLFMGFADGSTNFDELHGEELISEYTRRLISGTYYRFGESYNSKFAEISSAFEECRADAIGIYLSLFDEVLTVFGYPNINDESAAIQKHIAYINWLVMARSGIYSLKYYNPEARSWGQAHSWAAHVIFRVMLEHGGSELLEIRNITSGVNSAPDFEIILHEDAIYTIGKRVIGDLINHLQVYRSTGDADAAKAYFLELSELDPERQKYLLDYRDIVMALKSPQRMIIQPNTVMTGLRVELVEYPDTSQGMIMSYLDRFPDLGRVRRFIEEDVLLDLEKGYYNL